MSQDVGNYLAALMEGHNFKRIEYQDGEVRYVIEADPNKRANQLVEIAMANVEKASKAATDEDILLDPYAGLNLHSKP